MWYQSRLVEVKAVLVTIKEKSRPRMSLHAKSAE
jgi:hypothetical protein